MHFFPTSYLHKCTKRYNNKTTILKTRNNVVLSISILNIWCLLKIKLQFDGDDDEQLPL